jgi:NADH-quinone oxidoreductase subunit N
MERTMLHDLLMISPLLLVLLGALFTLLVDPFLDGSGSRNTSGSDNRFWGHLGAALSFLALLAGAALWITGPHEMETVAFAYHLSVTPYSLFFVMLLSVCSMLTFLASPRYLEEHGISFGEFYALVHFATFGMMVMVSAESMLTLFIGLETMSLAIYVLAAFKRRSQASVEAGVKYFIMGAVASAFLLYGMAFIFGLTGGTSFVEIERGLAASAEGRRLYLALAVVFTGGAFLFKVAAVPFHMWTPDAYEGAPTPVAGFMASGVKVAAFGAFLKFIFAALSGAAMLDMAMPIAEVLAVVAVITMTVGNLMALPQRNVKRVLGYSAVAHAGYLLLGCVAYTQDPVLGGNYMLPGGNVPFYLVGYALASLAAFAALSTVGADDEELTREAQLAGLGRRYPLAGAVLTLAMLSLAGVPPTLGFFGKFQMIREILSVDNGHFLPYVIIMIINSIVSAYYYLRVTVYVYMSPEGALERNTIRSPSLTWAMGIAAAALLLIGMLPGKFIEMSDIAAHTVRTRHATTHLTSHLGKTNALAAQTDPTARPGDLKPVD